MIEKMKYDGFRYDMTKGYLGEYLKMYNEEAKPYFSVSEFWSDANAIAEHLAATGYNTLAFDFPLKWDLNSAFSTANANYGKLKGLSSTLRGKGLAKYTVTFIDNHDTFDRDNNCEFAGDDANLDDATIKNKILQANAYILMMPGVPCVFYPHWVKYGDAINALIAVRKLAGIHSESVVSNEDGTSTKKYYSAMIQGHRGNIVLRLGPKRSTTVPEGYHLALDGSEYGSEFAIYVSDNVQAIDEVGVQEKSKKFMKDGNLYIRHGERVYDVTGRVVE
jgi:alpha-amylase